MLMMAAFPLGMVILLLTVVFALSVSVYEPGIESVAVDKVPAPDMVALPLIVVVLDIVAEAPIL